MATSKESSAAEPNLPAAAKSGSDRKPRARNRRKRSSSLRTRTAKLLKLLGPGLNTGAADDDPSGIATYSSVGAQFGYAILWTMPFIYPFMAAIQERSVRELGGSPVEGSPGTCAGTIPDGSYTSSSRCFCSPTSLIWALTSARWAQRLTF